MSPRLLWLLCLFSGPLFAQFQMPMFVGGIPGANQMESLSVQRHQARTLLYLEAIEELKKNPAAADVPNCATQLASQSQQLCLNPPAPARTPPPQASVATPAPTASDSPHPTASSGAPRRIALLVGNNLYRAPIPELETPIADVESIAAKLKQLFGFETRIVRNASKANIIQALNQLAEETTPHDTVLIFYAGHGYEVDSTRMGYWIPVDGSNRSAAKWISNTDISKLLAAIPAGQVLLISDSCFSGTLTKEHKVEQFGVEQVPQILQRRSVLAFSSGDEEPVSDEGKDGHSIFAWSLLQTLQDSSHTTPGYQIYERVRQYVTANAEQTPQYGAVISAGHDAGGEYLFMPFGNPGQ